MSEQRHRIDVEPLSDVRWSRIERDLFAKLDRAEPPVPMPSRARVHPKRMALLVGMAAASIGVAVLLVGHSRRELDSADPLRLVTTDSVSRATIGGASLTLAPRSLVMVRGDDEHGIDVVLDQGSVTCEVAPRRGRPPFVVDAADVRVRVVGTRFTVSRQANAVSVHVDRGVVEVAARGLTTLLQQGNDWGEQVDIPAPSSSAPSTIALAPASEPAPAYGPVLSPAQAVLTASGQPPTAAAARARAAPSPSTSPVSAPPPGQAASPMQPWPQELDGTEQRTGAPSSPTPAAPSAQQLFESAARMERSHPDQAAALYRQLVTGDTPWAQNALFALARLEADRGHQVEAARLLRSYLAKYPSGINADDARELLQRMQ